MGLTCVPLIGFLGNRLHEFIVISVRPNPKPNNRSGPSNTKARYYFHEEPRLNRFRSKRVFVCGTKNDASWVGYEPSSRNLRRKSHRSRIVCLVFGTKKPSFSTKRL